MNFTQVVNTYGTSQRVNYIAYISNWQWRWAGRATW